jgi:hypothetical protein
VSKRAISCSPIRRARFSIRSSEISTCQSDLILVGGISLLKPALRLMTSYRLVIQDVAGSEVLTSYTRWLEAVQLREGENQEVYVAFSSRFERVWLESRSDSGTTWSRSQPTRGSEASTLSGCTVGLKSTSRPEPKAFRSRSSEKFSDWRRSKMRTEMSFRNRPCRSGPTSARERSMWRSWRSIRRRTWGLNSAR